MTHVLVLEDDLSMRGLLKTLLTIEKFQVSAIETLDETLVLQQIETLKPDIIFMDVNLKELSGLAILEKIRRNPVMDSTRIVMTSGEDVRHECMQAGATDFFLKPYMPSDLIMKLRTLV
jgi:DNA-binding response OmpR family regulator